MNKKEYMKPEQRVVVLQYRAMLLDGSPLTTTSTNLDPEDEIDIIDTPGIIVGR